MKDIETRKDIDHLVSEFYRKAMRDELIGHFFTLVVPLDLKEHLPVIASFWEGILLGSTQYKGNPMIKHIELSRKSKLEDLHFNRWLRLWQETVRSMFQGERAELAVSRSNQIAQLMIHKIKQNP